MMLLEQQWEAARITQQAGQNHRTRMGTGEEHPKQVLGDKHAPLGLNSLLHQWIN